MSVATIKSITKQIKERYGTTEAAGKAAGVSPGVWSGYENADHPETTIPIGRLLNMSLTTSERRAIASLFAAGAEGAVDDLHNEACEAGEAAMRVQTIVRLATADGKITETENRAIREAALAARAEMDDVIQGAV